MADMTNTTATALPAAIAARLVTLLSRFFASAETAPFDGGAVHAANRRREAARRAADNLLR